MRTLFNAHSFTARTPREWIEAELKALARTIFVGEKGASPISYRALSI